ncbi:acylneuraminate cytidylyltransferase [Gilvibacter sp. SZ-19]|uniref:acylneuraminate cytidylyltransferase family protein n=1 Tax=Gilvibacter sp. SZ-19 TaxID=754429 RepID=UPI000B3C0C93|nr:acylneuraminate cytidylyltransferase family protein [Gilvibacter sp. SZ-19]ARV12816.1 acylneuraminate cytidylyltransferase [Gilvibacter sp. SZ-19]
MRILGLIPARGGSKGIPAKNSKMLGDKPLMAYTAAAAQEAQMLTDVVFSSEDEQLMDMAKGLGLWVPFKRPIELATDQSGSLEVVNHALDTLASQGYHYDAVCLLQLTTPFRTSTQIDSAVKKYIDDGADSLISVIEVPHQYNPHWVFMPTEKGLRIATGDSKIIKRRQELPPCYVRDGAIYITANTVLQDSNSFYGEALSYVVHPSESAINLDTLEDWERAEQWLKASEA